MWPEEGSGCSRVLPFLFVIRFASVALLLSGCGRLPETFAPPVQRTALAAAPFVVMSDPHADDYIEQGFRDKSEGPWRWAREHPVLRFRLPRLATATFHMRLTRPGAPFPLDAPMTLTFSCNGHVFDRARFEKPGEFQYEHAVPVEFLKPDVVNLIAIDPDKTVARPGEKLSFVVIRAGFTE
jgi:hypothetical protein